nr:glycosyltransferase family 4 protein [Microvirga antarctica]
MGPVAFYAPLKSPDHPSPSGDRTMARLLLKALQAAGFSPDRASDLRTRDGRGDPAAQGQIRDACLREADRLVTSYRRLAPECRPVLWFTYHVYYKAPDWIGPPVADALGIPYVIAEGSRAGKRATGPWALGHRGAVLALDRADVIFSMTANDRDALARDRPAGQRIVDLPPFLDLSDRDAPISRTAAPDEPLRLLTVAMMRPGDKAASYRILAAALARIEDVSWTLEVVGDGEARPEIEALFAPLGPRVRFHGTREGGSLRAFYGNADLFVWPAVNEAYGMVLLEAQSAGIPVVAGDFGGVAAVMQDGRTGCLTAPGDAQAFADALGGLMADPTRRRSMGGAARLFVESERTLAHAAIRLRESLCPLLGKSAA